MFRLFIVGLLICAGSSGSGRDEKSPPPSQVRPAGNLQLTPGQQISAQQAQITQAMFSDVFGEDVVTQWASKWGGLHNTFLDFEDPQKRQIVRFLYEKLLNANFPRESLGDNLFIRIFRLKTSIERVHTTRLNEVIQQYFSGKFPGMRIRIEPKLDGVQLGAKVMIDDGNGRIHRLFHVKTHAEGRLDEKSTAAKIVSSKELFVYKLLEILGVSPEVHFFQRSPEDVYIATLDAKLDQEIHQQPADQQPAQFLTFSRWKEQKSDLPKLMGNFSTIVFKDFKKLDYVASAVEHDETSQQFMCDIMKLDLLSGILRISDTTTNPSNFGFIRYEASVSRIRLLDFRSPKNTEWLKNNPEVLKVTNEQVGSFLEGNGEFNYNGEHAGVKYTLHNREESLRVDLALKLLNTDLQNFPEAVQIAYEFINQYIMNTDVFQQKADELQAELDRYKEAVEYNFRFFREQLRIKQTTYKK